MKTKITFVAVIAWIAILLFASQVVEQDKASQPCIDTLTPYPGYQDDEITFHTDSDTAWYYNQ